MSPRGRRSAAAALALLATTWGLAGCITGERPTLAEEGAIGAPTGDPAVDAVLERLAGIDDAAFTADYRITNNFGPVERTARVVQDGTGRRSITIGDVRFLIDGASTATCRLDESTCADVIDDAAVSDLQVNHQFYGRSTAARLRTDAARNVSATEGYTAEIGGITATCAGVPVDGGTVVYCATDLGPVASYQGNDVLIQLTAITDAVDESAFERTR